MEIRNGGQRRASPVHTGLITRASASGPTRTEGRHDEAGAANVTESSPRTESLCEEDGRAPPARPDARGGRHRQPVPDRRDRGLGRRPRSARGVPAPRPRGERHGARRRAAPRPDPQGRDGRAAPAHHDDEGRPGARPAAGEARLRLRDPAQPRHVPPPRRPAPLRADRPPRPAPPHRLLLPVPRRRPPRTEHRRHPLRDGRRRHARPARHQGGGRARPRPGAVHGEVRLDAPERDRRGRWPTSWLRSRTSPERSSPTFGTPRFAGGPSLSCRTASGARSRRSPSSFAHGRGTISPSTRRAPSSGGSSGGWGSTRSTGSRRTSATCRGIPRRWSCSSGSS